MRRAAVDSARIVDGTITDDDVGVGLREANKVVSDKPPADYVTDGIDDDVEIQAAINELTSGRTWYEKVLLRGNFLIGSTIKLPDYTILELLGKIKLEDGANVNMIQNSDTVGGNSHIIMKGGVLDGNRANQTASVRPILLSNVEDTIIKDMIIENPYHNAARIENGRRVAYENLVVKNCGAHGLYFYQCSRARMKNIVIEYAALDGFAVSGAYQSVFEGITLVDVKRNAFSFDGASHCAFNDITIKYTKHGFFGYVGCNKLTFSNIIIEEAGSYAARLYVETARTVRDISILNSQFHNVNSLLYADIPVILLECKDAGGVIKNVSIKGCHIDAPNATYCVEERQIAGSIDATMFCNNIVEAIGTAPTSFVGLKSFAADNILP